MQITVNGQTRDAADNTTVEALLRELALADYTGVAVELNGAFVERENYAATRVGADAVIEIVRFVGGG